MMKKRVLSLILVACLVLPLVVTTAFALPKDVTIINIPEAVRGAMERPSEGMVAVYDMKNFRCVGYMDYKSNMVIPMQFQVGGQFHGGLAVVQKDDKWGAINKTGTLVIPNVYDEADSRFWDGLLAVKKDGKWGMINSSGAVVIPLMYDELEYTYDYGEGIHFVEGILMASLNGTWGAIDKQNQVAIPFLYADKGSRYNNLIYISKNVVENGKTVQRKGAITPTGNPAIAFEHENLMIEDASIVNVKKGGKWGVMDIKTGAMLVDYKYDEILGFEGDFSQVKNNGKVGYINRAGVEIVPTEYTQAEGGFQDGCALLAKRPEGAVEGYWGYVDTTGKPITEFNYLDARPFSEGQATVSKGNNYTEVVYGTINPKGEMVIPFQHGYIGPFLFGRAFYNQYIADPKVSRKQGILDKTGKVIVSPKYTTGTNYDDYLTGDGDAYMTVTPDYAEFEARAKARYYTLDRAGKVVKPYGFDSIEPFYDGIALAHNLYANQAPTAWIINNGYKAPVDPTPNLASTTFPCNQSTILVNGTAMKFEGYTLTGNNYFKLRDLAMALNGTTGQFNVKWDSASGAVALIPGEAYVPVGGELVTGNGAAKLVAPSAAKTQLFGKDSKLVPVAIDGNNYYMLRGLMEKLGVTVGWDGGSNTITLTTKTAEQAATDGLPVTGTITDGVYAIKSAENRSIGFSVSGASTEAGGKITLYTTTEGPHYKFSIQSVADGKYTMSPQNSNLMVTSPQKKGGGMTQQSANGSAAQTFTITYGGDGTYRIQDCDGLYLAASGGKVENNVGIILWTRTEEQGQRFVFEKK